MNPKIPDNADENSSFENETSNAPKKPEGGDRPRERKDVPRVPDTKEHVDGG